MEFKPRPCRVQTIALTIVTHSEQTNHELRASHAQTRVGRSSPLSIDLHTAVSQTAAQCLRTSSPSLWQNGSEATHSDQMHYTGANCGQHRPARRIILRIKPQLGLRPPRFVTEWAGSEPQGRTHSGLRPTIGCFPSVPEGCSSGCG